MHREWRIEHSPPSYLPWNNPFKCKYPRGNWLLIEHVIVSFGVVRQKSCFALHLHVIARTLQPYSLKGEQSGFRINYSKNNTRLGRAINSSHDIRGTENRNRFFFKLLWWIKLACSLTWCIVDDSWSNYLKIYFIHEFLGLLSVPAWTPGEDISCSLCLTDIQLVLRDGSTLYQYTHLRATSQTGVQLRHIAAVSAVHDGSTLLPLTLACKARPTYSTTYLPEILTSSNADWRRTSTTNFHPNCIIKKHHH